MTKRYELLGPREKVEKLKYKMDMLGHRWMDLDDEEKANLERDGIKLKEYHYIP